MANPEGLLRTDTASTDPGSLNVGETNFKGKLNEFCHQRKLNLKFEELECRGPPHDPQFVFRAIVDGREFRKAEGKTKKEAEHKAACNALNELEPTSMHAEPQIENDEPKEPDSFDKTTNYVGKLHDYCQKNKLPVHFKLCERRGLPHLQQFVVKAVIENRKFREAEGNTKKMAEQKAAYYALVTLECTHVDRSNEVPAIAPQDRRSHSEICQLAANNTSETTRRKSISPTKSTAIDAQAVEDGIKNMRLDDDFHSEMENDEPNEPDSFDKTTNYVGKLHEYCQKNKLPVCFELCEQQGPPHLQQFVVQAIVKNSKFKEAKGNTKKMAERKAAYNALVALERSHAGRSNEVPAVAPQVRRRSLPEISQQAANNTSETTWRKSISPTKSTAIDDQAEEDGIKNVKLDDDFHSEDPSSNTDHRNDKVKNKMRKLAPSFSAKLDDDKRMCSLDESFNRDFEDISQLDKGGFGVVFKARKKIDDKYYAVKKVKFCSEKALREIQTLAQLDHVNIVRYYHAWRGNDTYVDPDESTSSYNSRSNSAMVYDCLFIQMELCEKGTLKDWISNRRDKVVEEDSFYIFEQMLQGVEYIHSKNLIHRDLKPSNIFFSEESKIKIGDFGLVTSMTDQDDKSLERTKATGTRGYMAPEQMSNQYEGEVDIYALGLILYELLWIYKTDSEKYRYWAEIRNGTFPDEFMNKYHAQVSWMKKMLSSSPKMRPSASSILQYMSNMNAKTFSKTI